MLIDGGGFGTITGNSFQIKQSAVAPSSASGLTAAEIEQMFSYLPDADLVTESGNAHTTASKILADIADSLVQHVQVLHQNWTGTASETAVGSFQQLHETAIGLAKASAQTGAVLTWMGGIIPFYKSYKAPALSLFGHVEAAFGDNPSDKAAQAVLERFNNRLVQANENLPPEVNKVLPTGGWDTNAPLTGGPGGPAGAGAAATGVSSTGGTGPGVGTKVPGGSQPVGTLPGGGGHISSPPVSSKGPTGTPPPTQLAGAPPGPPGGGVSSGGPPPGGVGAPPPPGSPPGGSGGSFPVIPGGGPPGDAPPPGGPGDLGDPGALGDGPPPGDPGLVGEGGGFPGEGVVGVAPGDTASIGSDGMIGAGPGGPGGSGEVGVESGRPGVVGLDEAFPDGGAVEGGAANGFLDGSEASGLGAGDSGATGFVGADGAAVDAGADEGGMGLPMGGTSGAGRQRERRREAWMAEDADLWEGPAEQVPSQISS
jgi:hypothetical protein